ncbi:ABC transporter permease [Vallitalea sp.]|uniref:ABC transporter permease n=1 Tax=Vallitalea sp. TaxID=1882829 RepID=UPI0025DE369B|nr:ABC transporter permease [Vallitalea sp.]MCT4686135.1 ABC transporter permease [Vallitalea sp.]
MNRLRGLLTSKDNKVFMSITAMIMAILVSGAFIGISGYSPIEALKAIILGAFDGKAAIARTLTQATPLILSGLAFAIAGKANMINLGVEGQLYLGALGAAYIATTVQGIPSTLVILLAIGAGMAIGGFYAGIVGFMKVKFGSNEVIATIMLNSIAVLIANYLVSFPLKAEGSVIGQTEMIGDQLRLIKLVPKSQLTVAFIIAVLACFIAKYVIDNTILGYEIKVVGLNKRAANTAGINVGRTVMTSMFLSGAVAGLAGAVHVLGVDGRFIVDFSPGYGFSGIAVSALAAGSPIGVLFSGLVFGVIRAGSMILDLKTDIPLTYADIVQALVIIFVATPLLIKEILSLPSKVKKCFKEGGHHK